ncbi:SBBP repeat-containing protein [Archangium violaceum]|uniref:SBBP repeat-containing protein n=1 Tax=Archangium violaceum TaxID=83451 RepID=UPI0036DAC2D7
MRFAQKLRNTLLTGAMALLAIPGCQGGEPAAEPSPRAESAQELGCFMNLVPTMTSAYTPAGTVTRSGVYDASYEAWLAFDASLGSMWISAVTQTPAWIAYEFSDGPKKVNKYALHYVNGNITTRAPKNWTFEGWNGSAWVVLDTRTNQTGWAGHERREFTLASPATYAKYRLNVTDDNDSRAGVEVISLGRMELIGCATGGVPIWTRLQGSAGGFIRVHDLATDPAGRSYTTGMTTGSFSGPLVGVMDGFLNAYDWNGNLIWSRQMGAPNTITLGYGIVRNRRFEEIFVGGFTGGALDGGPLMSGRDAFVTKYRYTGVRGWTRQIGAPGASTEGYGIGVDAADNSFLVGSTDGSLDGNTRIGAYDAFVTKYDAAGNKQWTRTVGANSSSTHARRAAADDAGNVYVSGWTSGALDGNVRVGTQDFFITKYSAAGVKQWTRQLGAAGGASYLYGSALDSAGNVYVTGYNQGGGIDGNPSGSGIQMFLAKYDPAGNKQWVRQFGSPHGAWGTGIAIDSSGVYVGGSGSGDLTNPSSASTQPHTFIAKYDTSGNLQYISQQEPATLGGVEKYGAANGIGLDDYGYAYLGGFTEGNLAGVNLTGNPDGFVMKLRLP